MKWERPDDVYNRKGSYRYMCSACHRQSYFVHGNIGHKNKEENPKCEYIYCPWCGERNEEKQ